VQYFVGVGAQKAGTTWLYEQLALHPQVAVPALKELHYFDMVDPTRDGQPSFGNAHLRAIRNGVSAGKSARVLEVVDVLSLAFNGDQAYRDYLARTSTTETSVVGEVTPAYSVLTDAGFAHMSEALDDPRVIFLMRDPIDRYWSATRMFARDPSTARDAFGRLPMSPRDHARNDYATTVAALDRHFSRVLYLFFEDLFTETALQKVARFLEVDERWDWDPLRVANRGLVTAMPDPCDHLVAELRPTYEFVRERFGDDVPHTWRF
jgi:hypothetical protein